MASWLCIRLLDDLKKPLFPQQICVSLICTNDAIIANIKKDPPSKKNTTKKKQQQKQNQNKKKNSQKTKQKTSHLPMKKFRTKPKENNQTYKNKPNSVDYFFFHSTFDCIKKINEFYL